MNESAMTAIGRLIIVAGVALGTAACTTPYEGRYDFYAGWRKAEITRIVPFETLSAYEVPHCKSAPALDGSTGTNWAIVRYRQSGRSRHVSAPMARADEHKVGDLVYVNVSECARELRSRAS